MASHEEELNAKEVIIKRLKAQLSREATLPKDSLRAVVVPEGSRISSSRETELRSSLPRETESRVRRGKAPPVDPFTGEKPDILLDDWIPTLEWASAWNGWADEELLLQLAGHLRGRAQQEWSLISPDSKRTYSSAVDALQGRLDPGSKALAAQDFRHISQGDKEKVADFTSRLEHTFKVAYGWDPMSEETQDALLHGQLQDRLRYELMRAPVVSGAQTFKE